MNYWGWNGKEWFWHERSGHPAAAGTSPTVIRNPANGEEQNEEQFVYYQGANGNIDYWGWRNKEWTWSELAGHAAAAGTSPTAVRNPVNGFQFVYYQAANGNIDYWGWNGKEWFWHERSGHPAAAGTSPTVIRNPANGEEQNEEQFVYYQGANGNIDYWGWRNKEWTWSELAGHAAAAGTSPTAVRNPVNGFQFVYYQAANGNIDYWGWNGKEWFWHERSGHPAAAGTSPTVIRNPANGEEQNEEQFVYYQGANGNIDYWGWKGKEWSWHERAGHPAAAGTSPTVVRNPANGEEQNEEQVVYYQGANGNIDYWGWNGKEWFWYERPGHAALVTAEPEVSSRWASRDPVSGEQWVYYAGANSNINYWTWNTKEWFWFERAGHATAASTNPTVLRNPVTAEQWVSYQNSGGAISVWTWDDKEWAYSELGGHSAAANTSPAAIRNISTNEMLLYYDGANGNIDLWSWAGREWAWSELVGHPAAGGTSPTAVRNPVNGFQFVYYQGANGNIDYWGWNGKEWSWHERAGHPAAAGASPTVVRNPANGEEQNEEQFVYYQGANGNIDYWGWRNKEWTWSELVGHPAAGGTSPTAVRNPVNGFQFVYYQGANGNIDYWGWNGKEWSWHERAGHPAAAGASPTVVRNPANGEEQNEEQFVYYQGANGNIDYWGWNGKEWFWSERAGHPA